MEGKIEVEEADETGESERGPASTVLCRSLEI
jgi:hypothetical protein